MRSSYVLVALVPVFAFSFAGCNSDPTPTAPTAGPIDGYYVDQNTESTCNGTNEGAHEPETMTLSGATFTHTETKGTNCVKTDTGPVSYSGTNGITITQLTQTCSSGCTGAGDCSPSGAQPANIGTYSLSGTTLTFTFTNSPCNQPTTNTATEVNAGYVKQ